METDRSPFQLMRNFGRFGAVAVGLVATEAMYAVLRPVPEQVEFDASTVLGPDDGVELSILVLGDSSCTGPGLANADEVWVRQTAADLAALGFRVGLDSIAVGGATTADLIVDQLPRIAKDRYDVILVSVGGNDVLKGVPIRVFEADLTALTRQLADKADLVVLSGVGDLGSIPRLLPPLRELVRARAKRFDAVHGRVARALDVIKADQWTPTTSVLGDRANFTADLFHPGAIGHRAWADVATVTLQPHLEQFRNSPR